MTLLLYATVGRRFSVTGSGTIGLGSELMREGDTVMIFAGAPVPYLLWKTE